MTDDPKTPPATNEDEPLPIVPDLSDAEKPGENVEEKGEPFDGNFA